MDHIDLKILKLLQENGKITNLELSGKISLSPASTLERVKKLENSGVIKSYHAVLDEGKLGNNIKAFVLIYLSQLKSDMIKDVARQIQDIEVVRACYHITGKADFLIEVVSKDIQSYQAFISDELSKISGVGRTETMMVLSNN